MTAQHIPGQCITFSCRRKATESDSGGSMVFCYPCKDALNRGIRLEKRRAISDMGKELIQLHQDKAELLEVAEEIAESICYICKIHNPQHENCEHCEDMDGYKAAIAKARPQRTT